MEWSDYVQPVCLPETYDRLITYDWFQNVYVLGWGLTEGCE
jgi:hypothetical protein